MDACCAVGRSTGRRLVDKGAGTELSDSGRRRFSNMAARFPKRSADSVACGSSSLFAAVFLSCSTNLYSLVGR